MRGWFIRLAAALVLAPAVLFGGYVGYLHASGNFDAVAPGVVYRAAQPDAEDIASFAKRAPQGSVINLRGAAPEKAWYKTEVAAAKAGGLAHFDFKMSANKRISPERARELIALIEQAPKPVLIHCKAGADRSGLAAALYLYAKGDGANADRQLSLLYGHVPYLWSRTGAMDASLAAYLDDARIAGQDAPALASQ